MALCLRFFWVFLFLLNPVFSQTEEFRYNKGFKEVGKNISFNGVAEIEKNGIIQLTNDTSRLMGHAFYDSPLRFKNTTDGRVFSFSTSFAFAIVPQYPKLGGHGLAFTISPTKELTGALGRQYLGLFNTTNIGDFSDHIFAVEFDTVQDLEFGDISDNHVGIDINSLQSNYSVDASYFTVNSTKQNLTLKSGKIIQAWIDYDSVRNLMNVTISPFSSKPSFPILSFNLDLSPILQDSMYVGFSASTGLLASFHYVFGWSFKMNGASQSLDLSVLPSIPGPEKKNTAFEIGASVSSAIFIFLTIAIAVYLFRKIMNADVIEAWEYEIGPHRFKYQELKLATKNFREKELLGVGGFGKVYRGTLPNCKTQVAVKRISHESKQGLQEFLSEIACNGRLRHRNLVQLLGWCRRRGDLLLVYEFMPNGSLDKFIFDEPKSTLFWEQRFKIIKGVASGLLYLHEEWEQVVIHRDVKAANVLLDTELNGRLGDFGLARLYEHGSNPSTTRVVGTLGYLAPEVTRTGKGTTSSDVFAFGALLLEIACGRRPIEPKALPEELILVDYVWEKWNEGKIFDVVDQKLKGDFNEEEVIMVLKLGMICSNSVPEARLRMRQVVRYLEGEMKLPEIMIAPVAGKNEEGFDDFPHSYPSSNLEISLNSFTGEHGDGD